MLFRSGGEALFEFFDAVDQVRDFAGGGLEAVTLHDGLGGEAHVGSGLGDVFGDTGPGEQGDLAGDLQVATDADLAGDGDVVSKACAASEGDEGDDDAVLPKGHVVPDLHEVVDLGACADPGAAKARTVDQE